MTRSRHSCAGIGALAPLGGSLVALDLSYSFALQGATLGLLPRLRLLNLHWYALF